MRREKDARALSYALCKYRLTCERIQLPSSAVVRLTEASASPLSQNDFDARISPPRRGETGPYPNDSSLSDRRAGDGLRKDTPYSSLSVADRERKDDDIFCSRCLTRYSTRCEKRERGRGPHAVSGFQLSMRTSE